MIVVRTIGAIDIPKFDAAGQASQGPRKLPAPKTYVLIVVLWSIFGLIADAGAARVAAIMSWVTVLTAMVTGNTGTVLTGLLKTIAQTFKITPSATSPQGETLT
jgi:hypothetical protein